MNSRDTPLPNTKFFKGTSTIKSLLMHPKDPVPVGKKTDIIYHCKCPAHICTAEHIIETNRSLRERVSDHKNQTTCAMRNQHISTNHPTAELIDLTVIEGENNTLYHQVKEAVYIHIKDPSLSRTIGKVKIPPVFKKNFSILKVNCNNHRGSSLQPREHFINLSLNTMDNEHFYSSPSTSITAMFTSFKLQDN